VTLLAATMPSGTPRSAAALAAETPVATLTGPAFPSAPPIAHATQCPSFSDGTRSVSL